MSEIRLGCRCCSLSVEKPQKRGEMATYTYNGQRFVGQVALGRHIGRSAKQIQTRIRRGHCLVQDTQHLRSALASKKDYVSAQHLAAMFLRLPRVSL